MEKGISSYSWEMNELDKTEPFDLNFLLGGLK